ncbi:minor histocompatibility antigen H13, partial [Phenoliferia sp. Uapishka_3]
MSSNTGLFQAYGALLFSALVRELPASGSSTLLAYPNSHAAIVAGSHSSLVMPKEAKRQWRASRGEAAEEDEAADDEEIDRLTAGDAYLFPVLGSAVLVSLFLAFKYLGKDLINMVLGYYFVLVGTGGVARMIAVFVKATQSERRWKAMSKWNLALKKNAVECSSLSFNSVDVGSILGAIFLSIVTRLYPHWTASNFIALSLSFNAISLLRIDSFWTGSALLSGLFLYDIWWVFGTNVMVLVARDFDAPIKIVWPKEMGSSSGFTLLGLGDIVLPGVFIALCLRFDYSNALRLSPPPKPSSAFRRPYFTTCFIAYISGLVATIYVMHTFKAAQPALLYLSPACILSVIGCAYVRGELPLLWAYDDGANDEKKEHGKKERGEDSKRPLYQRGRPGKNI